MVAKARSRHGRVGIIAVIVTVAVVLSCGGIESEELLCEEAVLRVEDCCEKIDINRFNCVEDQGCLRSLTPIFNKTASECILDTSCSDLVARGICDGVRQVSYGPYPNQDPVAMQKEACR